MGRQWNPILERRATIALDGRTLDYLVRRTPRARGMRLTVDPDRGLVVAIPPADRRGWARPDERIEAFVRERQGWIVRHLAKAERERRDVAALGGPVDGGAIYYLGEVHRIRVVVGPPGGGRSRVERVGAPSGDELLVSLAERDRRPVDRVLEDWLRDRAAEAIGQAIERHGAALRVAPASVVLRDPRTRWGSASRAGRLMFSWRLVLGPPDALDAVVVHELAHLRVFGHGRGFWELVASRSPDHPRQRAWLRRHSHILHMSMDSARVSA